jgi:hypothetical protein
MTEPEIVARERLRSLGTRDWFLQQLVRLTNERPEHAGFPVTLCVKGILVSGVLASGRAYFAEFAQAIAGSLTNVEETVRQNLREYFAAFGELYSRHGDKPGHDGDTEEILSTLPEFIHLREARIFDGIRLTPPGTQPGVWWRGRIAEIDGFVLGVLHPRPT